jgi:hypothetical protein
MLKFITALAASITALAASVLLFANGVLSGIFCALNAGFDLEGSKTRQEMQARRTKMLCASEWDALVGTPIVSAKKTAHGIAFTLEDGLVIEIMSVAHHTAGSHLEARIRK